MAITESGLAWCSNSSNSLTASSRPRLPERMRPAMARSSSKHRSRAALARRDMSAWGGKWPGHEREGRRPMRRRGLGGPAGWSGYALGSGPPWNRPAQARLLQGSASAYPRTERVIWAAARRVRLLRADLGSGVTNPATQLHESGSSAANPAALRVLNESAVRRKQRGAGGGATEPGAAQRGTAWSLRQRQEAAQRGRRAEHAPAAGMPTA